MVHLFHATGEHAVALAGSAREGLQCLRDEGYDLLVTDVGLPDESGLEMLDRARREGLLAETAVVVCSASHGIREQVLARDAGYVPKPVEPEQLQAAIRERLPMRPGSEGVASTKTWSENVVNVEHRGRMNVIGHRVSGYDFMRAMLLAGYRFVGTTMGNALLTKDDREILIPQRHDLTEEMVILLLAKANVGPLQFVALLNRLGSRDTWAEGEAPSRKANHRR
jgi:CheY-like chemotaxis protein